MHESIRHLASLFFVFALLMVMGIISMIVDSSQETNGLVSPSSEEYAVVYSRVRAKARIIDQMLAGNLNLFETAVRFKAINETTVKYSDRSLTSISGQSGNEKVCRQVILWYRARIQQNMDSCQCNALVNGLERQLERHIAENGTVILPKLPRSETRSSQHLPPQPFRTASERE